MDPHEPHETSALEHSSFLVLLVAVSVLFVWVAWPFAAPVLWATLAAIMFQPLYRWSLKLMRGRRNPAAVFSLFVIFVVVLLPALWIGSIVVDETVTIVNTLRENPIDVALLVDQVVAYLPNSMQRLAADNGWTNVSVLQARLEQLVGDSAGMIAQQAVSIGSGALGFVLSFGLMLYVLFFLLRDGSRIGETILHSAPIERSIADRLAVRFLGIVRAVIKGSGVIGIVQGALGAIMLMIAGVPSALLLGVLMAILALIPAVGTALVWGPVGLYLLLTDQVWQGVFVLGVGAIVIASVDNVLRPILVGRDTGIPDWIVLVTTLGGIALAGFSGIVIGPLVAGLFLASWSILQEQRAAAEGDPARYRPRVDKDGKARGGTTPDHAPPASTIEPEQV
ncbi:MAG: AI-2E family transporter [Erythrobacter sp.]|uniref:AI-2E family transporter n=1 Tax=Erythrobacter sp. TaxID=1042 RepID=UPI003C74336F